MNKKVYLFTAQQTYDLEVLDLIKKVFEKKEDAVAYLKKFVDGERENIKNSGWQIDEDCDTWFVAFEPFRYIENHIEVSVDEMEIE